MAALGTGPAALAVVSGYMPHSVDLCSATACLYSHGECTNAPSPAHAYKVTGTVLLRAETSVSSLPAVIRLALLVPLEGFMEQLDCLPARPRGRIDHDNVRRGLHDFRFVGAVLCIPYSTARVLVFCIAWDIVHCHHPSSSSSSSRMTASMIPSLGAREVITG